MLPEMSSTVAYRFAESLIGSTFQARDRWINAALWRDYKGTPHEAEFIRAYLDKRRYWMRYNIRTQRYWQSQTNNPNKAIHHDSIAIREKYVRLNRSV